MKSDGKVFSGDMEALVEQLLKRVEALEAEVALLKGEPLEEDAVSLDPIDLDFGQDDDILATPFAVITEVEEAASEKEEEAVEDAAAAEPVKEEEPVSVTAIEEVPEEEIPVTVVEEVTIEVETEATEPSTEETPVEEISTSEEIAPAEETVPPVEETVPVSEPEDIPMEDLPSDDDDLPFDLPDEDDPFGGLNPVEEAPVIEHVEEIIIEEPLVAVPEETEAPAEEEEVPAQPEEPSSEPEQPEVEEEPAPVSEETPAETPDDAEGDLFGLFGEVIEPSAPSKRGRPKKEVKNINEAVTPQESVMDALYMDSAWRKDIQGPEVRDIRSAISLNDRVLFINRLFRKDSMLYQDVIGKINGMNDLDEVVTFLDSTFPEWKMDSDDVYKFMMAVRRKIR